MTRERRIEIDARIIFELLRAYESRDRIFALSEIVGLVQRRLASRESSQYHLDFSQDEPPTNPDRRDSERETRAINVDTLRQLKKKSRDDK